MARTRPSTTMRAVAVALLTLAAFTSTTAAQHGTQQIITLPFYGYDDQPIAASVVAVTNQVTTLHLNCVSGTDGADCGLAPAQTLTVGPSTYNICMSVEDFLETQDCTAFGTTRAICAESTGGSAANPPGSSTTTYTGTEIDFMSVTITAGASKLAAAGGSAGVTLASSSSASTSLALSPGTSSNLATPSPPTETGQATASVSGTATNSSAPASSTGTRHVVAFSPAIVYGITAVPTSWLGYLPY